MSKPLSLSTIAFYSFFRRTKMQRLIMFSKKRISSVSFPVLVFLSLQETWKLQSLSDLKQRKRVLKFKI